MAASDLLFESPATGSADLVFGGSDPVGPALVEIAITGQFEPLSVSAGVAMVADVAITGSFEPLTVSASAEYRSNTQRPTVGTARTSYQVAQPASTGAEHRQHDATASPHGWEAFWQRATGLTPGVEHRQAGTLKPLRVVAAAQHQVATPVRDSKVFAHQVADRAVRKVLDTAFENASRLSAATLFRHQDGDRTKRAARRTYWQQASGLGARQWSSFQPASRLPVAWWSAWQEGVPPPPGVSVKPPGPPGPTPCYTPSPHLLFSFPPVIGGNLVFQCGDYAPGPQPGETIIVPVRRVYIVINDTSLRRVDGNIDLKASRISLSLDIDTWAWGLSATLPLSALPNLEQSAPGVPVEVEASINGTVIRALVESVSRQRTFTDASLSISGRGKTSLLAGGYAGILSLINDQDRTAQQLCADLLLDNGVPMPWTVDWQLTDWLVPAGAFVHQGDRISGLVSIAEAAGGFLRPHNSLAAVSILPRYATAPWNWASVTPEFVLPSDVTSRESMEWIERPAFNRVFVSGEDQGVLGQVTRTGTAGDLLAPMVTHPLITHADAARQRGIAELAKGGRIVKLGLRLPVLEETGVLLPGHMVQYDDAGTERIGRVNSVQVDVSGGADVWQAIELEAMA